MQGQGIQDVMVLVLKELGRSIEVIEGLRDEFRLLRDEVRLLKEELVGRKLRKGGKVVGGYRLKLSDLKEEELGLVERFLYWVWEYRDDWIDRYLQHEGEGFDAVRLRVYLRGYTFSKLMDRVCVDAYRRRDVLRLLGDLGLLVYTEDEEGRRQYSISVRVAIGRDAKGRERKGVATRYVINWERVEELTKELLELKRKGGKQVVEVREGEEGRAQAVESSSVEEEENQELKESEVSRIQIPEPDDDLPF